MLSLLILLILFYGVYVGARRGLLMQAYYTIGYVITFIIAKLGYTHLEKSFELIIPYPSATMESKFAFFKTSLGTNLDKSFYYGFSFIFICFVGWIIVRIGGLYLQQLTFYPMYEDINVLGGGLLGLINNYIGVFMVLFLLALIPIDGLQHALGHSWVATLIVKYSPGLTQLFAKWWFIS